MLPNEYQPLVLTDEQKKVHQQYTELGFKIAPRPFAGKGSHLWFFMSLVTPENPKGIEFTVNILNGVAHRTGTQTTYTIEEARKEFGPKTEASEPPRESIVLPRESNVLPAEPVPVKPEAVNVPAVPARAPSPPRSAIAETPAPAPTAKPKQKQSSLF